MMERFLNYRQLFQYRTWKYQLFAAIGFVIVFSVIGGMYIVAGNHLTKSNDKLSFSGYELATVISSFMKQNQHDMKLYLQVNLRTGETLNISTKSGSLFALSNQIICLKVFQNDLGIKVKASLAAPKHCEE